MLVNINGLSLDNVPIRNMVNPTLPQVLTNLIHSDIQSPGAGAGPGPSTIAQARATCTATLSSTQQSSFSSCLTPVEALIDEKGDELYYRNYQNEEEDLPSIIRLCSAELSEPYNVYTFRYFLMTWPHLTFLVFPTQKAKEAIAIIVCKQDSHRNRTNRGYIAMLSVDKRYRRRGIGRKLVQLEINEMLKRGAHEIVLETEYNNNSSLALYGSLGFIREKRLFGFYSSGNDAFRLILPLSTLPRFDESREGADAARSALSAEVPDIDPTLTGPHENVIHRQSLDLAEEILLGPTGNVGTEFAQTRSPLAYIPDFVERRLTPKPVVPSRTYPPGYII